MRRWNGWGEEGVHADLADGARSFLVERIGAGTPPRDAALAELVRAVPPSRLGDGPAAALLGCDPEDRVRHARGQSFPDLVALRSGRLGAVPDAVARPGDRTELRRLLEHARATGSGLVPRGGGTSVVGGTTTRPSPDPVIAVSLERLAGIRALDERSLLVTAGAGTSGPALATALAAHGLGVGHEPQSWEYATVGGWVAARGSGLRSQGAGRIEALYAGGTLEAPAGTLELPPHPASAAGPDLRQLVLGSEGRLGVLDDVVLRAAPLPESEGLVAWALPGLEAGEAAVRELAAARPGLSVLRLSTPAETELLLAFAGRTGTIRALRGWLTARGIPRDWALLLAGVAGRRRVARAALAETGAILRAHGGVRAPGIPRSWSRTRFRSPYLRTALWEAGWGSDTLETAAPWSAIPALLPRLEAAIAGALAEWGERVHVVTHLSHVYPTGTSLYATFLLRLADDPDETLERWRAVKAAAGAEIVAAGATISHHHGVGTDHLPWIAAEKGPLGIAALEAVARTLDPDGIMNPGVLIPPPAAAGTGGGAPEGAA